MSNLENFTIYAHNSTRDALRKLDKLALQEAVLFVLNENEQVVGSLTDGDIRRGLLKSHGIDDQVELFMNKNHHYLDNLNNSKEEFKKLKKKQIRFVSLLDKDKKLVKIIDTHAVRSILPMDVIIMAGGRGERLMPLTQNLPKPLLKVGDKPIIEHNVDRLVNYGVSDITITLRYLGDKISDYFKDGSSKGVSIRYVTETEPLGTMGSISLVKEFKHDYVLVMNSDLLTNIDFEVFFEKFIEHDADMIVATISYLVTVPYAVFDMKNDIEISAFKEKPQYTYYSNAGIYLMKKKLVQLVPSHDKFDATDLMNLAIAKKMKVIAEPILGYWLDIGRMEDYAKAQSDIKHLNLK